MALPAGTQLGRYTVLKPLASDGTTEVLLARAQGMGGFQHHVVIKAIRVNPSTGQRFIRAFVDEARLAASLHHHHVVQVHDVGREGDDYFFAMEYVHGENLRALLAKVARNGELVPLDQVITITLAVAAGLHHAHQQNIVHRDVTPANILVGYDGNVKVTDFGIAKALLQSSELTKSGIMRGKVAYMAPEQCLGRAVDRRADIFSLGIVLYELCTSRRLFKGDTDFMIMTSIVNGKVPKPTQYRADLPLDLEDVILKALAPKPELRFDTAEDLGMALERVAANNGIRISPTALGEYLAKLFGTRPEPWLVEGKLEEVDVDFDGGGTGLVEAGDGSALDRELLESPLLSPPDDDEFADEAKTVIQDDEDEPPTLTGGDNVASGFEANEQTLIGDQVDVDVFVGMSKIEGRRDTPPPATPRRDATPVPRDAPARRDATPVPRDAAPRRDATPVPRDAPARRDATPVPRTPTARPTPPAGVPAPIGAPGSGPVRATPAGVTSSIAPPHSWGTPPSGTGTPMAWTQDDEVPSLAPRGRRVVLIAAVAIPLVVVGIFVITRSSGGGGHASRPVVEPDAHVEPSSIDAATLAVAPDAAPPADAATAAPPPAPIDAAAPAPRPPTIEAVPPKRPAPVTKKPPITKRPPLKH